MTESADTTHNMNEFQKLQKELDELKALVGNMTTTISQQKSQLEQQANQFHKDNAAFQEQLRQAIDEIAATKQEIIRSQEELEGTIESAKRLAVNEAGKNAQSLINGLRTDIVQGAVIALKAVMLRARNNNHWMRFRGTTEGNRELFSLFRSDGEWFDNIKVPYSDHADILRKDIKGGNVIAQKAVMLQARNTNHWMRFRRTTENNVDLFQMWRIDGEWFDLVRAG